MKQQELMQLIADGESETFEFKESFDNSTITSTWTFSNTKSGVIFQLLINKISYVLCTDFYR